MGSVEEGKTYPWELGPGGLSPTICCVCLCAWPWLQWAPTPNFGTPSYTKPHTCPGSFDTLSCPFSSKLPLICSLSGTSMSMKLVPYCPPKVFFHFSYPSCPIKHSPKSRVLHHSFPTDQNNIWFMIGTLNFWYLMSVLFKNNLP